MVWQVMMIQDPELFATDDWLQAPIRVFQEDEERRQLPAYQPRLYDEGDGRRGDIIDQD